MLHGIEMVTIVSYLVHWYIDPPIILYNVTCLKKCLRAMGQPLTMNTMIVDTITNQEVDLFLLTQNLENRGMHAEQNIYVFIYLYFY